MIKRATFKLAMGDTNTVFKNNLSILFRDIDEKEHRYCAIEHEEMRDKSSHSIVAYFFRHKDELDEFVLFKRLIYGANLHPYESSEVLRMVT